MLSPPVQKFTVPRWARHLACPALLIATVLAYSNSFNGPFIFDDHPTIVENPSIRKLWPLTEVLSPPNATGLPVNGRPLVNLTLALNFAAGELDPRGYHAFNLTLHLLAGLTLYGVIRRTLTQPRLSTRFGNDAALPAFFIVLLWSLHPLQTAAVSYIVQRAEVMVSLFYLLTLYCFIRSNATTGRRPGLWQILAVLACAAGMATKEVMASAPLIVLLYDRTFIGGSLAQSLRLRRFFYASLASTWLILAALMLHSGSRGGTAGFALPISPIDYGITQIGAVAHYLRLAIWPAPLVFDYGGTVLIKSLSAVWPQAIVLLALIVATLWAVRRNSPLGFAGAWFFAILAPSSSIVPIADTMFEHRMYLPLVPVIGLVCGVLFNRAKGIGTVVCSLASLALASSTFDRNFVYQDELAIWSDTVSKRPGNVRAHYTIGSLYAERNLTAEALACYNRALALAPRSFETHNNLGNLLTRAGRADEAREHFEFAIQIRPASAEAHNNLGNALLATGRPLQAQDQYRKALTIDPYHADAHNNLGNILMRLSEASAAIDHYRMALKIRAGFFDAELNLANALAESNEIDEALAHYRAALGLRPGAAKAHYNLALTLERINDLVGARSHYGQALQIDPHHSGATNNLRRLSSRPLPLSEEPRK